MKTPKSPPSKGLQPEVVTYLTNMRDDMEAISKAVALKFDTISLAISAQKKSVNISSKKMRLKGCVLMSSSQALTSYTIVKQGTEFVFTGETTAPSVSLTFLLIGE